jgi:two-component sensor histidine kinase
VARNKKIRVSEEELKKLKEYRDIEYDSSIPLGFVISELVQNE